MKKLLLLLCGLALCALVAAFLLRPAGNPRAQVLVPMADAPFSLALFFEKGSGPGYRNGWALLVEGELSLQKSPVALGYRNFCRQEDVEDLVAAHGQLLYQDNYDAGQLLIFQGNDAAWKVHLIGETNRWEYDIPHHNPLDSLYAYGMDEQNLYLHRYNNDSDDITIVIVNLATGAQQERQLPGPANLNGKLGVLDWYDARTDSLLWVAEEGSAQRLEKYSFATGETQTAELQRKVYDLVATDRGYLLVGGMGLSQVTLDAFDLDLKPGESKQISLPIDQKRLGDSADFGGQRRVVYENGQLFTYLLGKKHSYIAGVDVQAGTVTYLAELALGKGYLLKDFKLYRAGTQVQPLPSLQ